MFRSVITLYEFVLEHYLTLDNSPCHDKGVDVSPLHIALFLSGLAGGGAQRRMLLLAEGFTARGHRVDLVVPRPDGPYRSQVPAAAQLVILDNSLARLPGIRSRRGLWVASSTRALARYLEQVRPDVLLSTSNPANLAALWGSRRAGVATPVVISVNVNLGAATGGRQPAWGGLLRMLVRRWYPCADAVIAISSGVAQDLAAVTAIRREQISVIENPVPAAQIRELSRTPLDHPWFTPGQPPVVLGVGKLKKQKDFGTLLRAFARVRGQRQARLVILGEGEERNVLERLVRDLGISADVYLPGFMENPYAWMTRADVFVLSSAWEGFSNVLCEALACADGTHIDNIRVELCRAGTEKVKYMEFIMTNCIISNYQVSGDGEDSFPIETIGINFGKIQWVYTVQKRAGGVSAGNIATGWNLERNSKA